MWSLPLGCRDLSVQRTVGARARMANTAKGSDLVEASSCHMHIASGAVCAPKMSPALNTWIIAARWTRSKDSVERPPFTREPFTPLSVVVPFFLQKRGAWSPWAEGGVVRREGDGM